jgi:tetratricopeptide (TPR) repeat protein
VDNLEKIELYINNQLQGQDKEDFEASLQNDAELAETYAMYVAIEKNMQSNYDAEKEVEFKESLATYQNQYFSNKTKTKAGKVRNLLYYATAAAAILVLVFTFNVFKKTKNSTTEELYAEYAPFEKITEITRSNNKDSLFKTGANFYNAKNYIQAIPYFEKVLDSNAQAHFLYAVCFMELNNNDKAFVELDKLINGQSSYKEKAEFYKALLFLKNKNVEGCKQMLLSINRYSSYNDQAKALYNKLDK